MNGLRIFIQYLAAFALIFAAHAAIAQDAVPSGEKPERYVEITLIPEKTHINSGDRFTVAIEQDIYPEWHTYWLNAGDSGEPMRAKWTVPDGFETGKLHFPVPHKIPVPPLANYGYSGKAVFLQDFIAPDLNEEGPLELTVYIELLVCKEICIPEYGTYKVTLNSGEETDNSGFIEQARAAMPIVHETDALFSEEDEIFKITMAFDESVPTGRAIDLFPYEWGIIDNTAQASAVLEHGGNLSVIKERGDRKIGGLKNIKALLVFENDEGRHTALEITAEPDPVWLESLTEEKPVAVAVATETAKAPAISGKRHEASQTGLAKALLFALFGGLILNLMPCVFPVLSIKALSLSKMTAKKQKEAKLHGIAYTAGILLCFGLIASILIALKAAGEEIGWGFQLQNPVVVLSLSYLLFVIGLNLSGVFEFGNAFANVGSKTASKQNHVGSFMTGVLAALVATPCTAPFMGAAMGYALTQPAFVSLTVFLALGFGLALPYLLLSFFPKLRAFMPKPGKWMDTFKQFLAFPMYASAAWLVWVFSLQVDATSALYALIGMPAIAFAFWLLHVAPKKGGKRIAVKALAFLIMLTVIGGTFCAAGNSEPAASATTSENAFYETYSNTRLAELEKTDRPIFVNMTAAWCITCKVNERVALNIDNTKILFTENNVAYLKGDWTNRNPEITAFLDHYGRNGVPIYVFYPAPDKNGKRPEPVVLPQILTPGIIKDFVKGSS